VTALTSVQASRASWPISRPRPDCLQPPKGAQLCHAPQVLAAAGTLTGRRTAAYPALAPDVAAAGAEYVDSAAVVDGQMVSARAWPDHPAWMREFIQILRSKAPA